MKKSRMINIVLTAIMLLTTILTPQMAYTVSAEFAENKEEMSKSSQTLIRKRILRMKAIPEKGK